MREFGISMDVMNRTWKEIESEEETYDDATATVVENDQGAVTIALDLYYSKHGRFEMTITQPMDRAVQTFMAALAYDTATEVEHAS